jgi:hypothetical protein
MDDFVHIPKTSGSSMRTVLARQYGIERIAYYEPGNSNLHAADALGVLKSSLNSREINLVTGHHSFGLHADLRQPLRYFTLIRDPIARAASDYFFAYQYTHHRFRNEILSGALTPEAFLIEGRGMGNPNWQCSQISGRIRGEDAASAACEIIRRCFVGVGVTERFEASLLLIAKRLGWKVPLYTTRNVTRLSPEIERIRIIMEDRVRATASELYAADLKLHRFANSKLDQEIAAEGGRFEQALEAFNDLQRRIDALDDVGSHGLYNFAPTDRLPNIPDDIVHSEAYRFVQDYLADSSRTIGMAANYLGYVDTMNHLRICGWAVDLCSDLPMEVRAYRGGKLIGSATANLPRPDVASAIGVRSEVGFNITLEHNAFDLRERYVCYSDSQIRI